MRTSIVYILVLAGCTDPVCPSNLVLSAAGDRCECPEGSTPNYEEARCELPDGGFIDWVNPPDAGPDGGALDAADDGGSGVDAGTLDAGAPQDAGRLDAEPAVPDAGHAVDAGPVDSGTIDGGPEDAGPACTPATCEPERDWGIAISGTGNVELTRVAADDARVVVAAAHSGAVALDGRTLSTGHFLAEYDHAGVVQWAIPLPGRVRDIALDASGRSYVVGAIAFSDPDFGGGPLSGEAGGFIASYSASGVHRWSRLLGDGFDDPGEAHAVAIDGRGRVCAGGRTEFTLTIGGESVRDGFVACFALGGGSPELSRHGDEVFHLAPTTGDGLTIVGVANASEPAGAIRPTSDRDAFWAARRPDGSLAGGEVVSDGPGDAEDPITGLRSSGPTFSGVANVTTTVEGTTLRGRYVAIRQGPRDYTVVDTSFTPVLGGGPLFVAGMSFEERFFDIGAEAFASTSDFGWVVAGLSDDGAVQWVFIEDADERAQERIVDLTSTADGSIFVAGSTDGSTSRVGTLTRLIAP